MARHVSPSDTYSDGAAAAESAYVDQLMRQGGLDRRQALSYIDCRPLDELPFGVRGRSFVRRMRARIQSEGHADA